MTETALDVRRNAEDATACRSARRIRGAGDTCLAALLGLLGVSLLSACGQSGPLTLPSQQDAGVQGAAGTAQEREDDEEDDER